MTFWRRIWRRRRSAAACRIFDIARAAKETPDVPAVDIVPEDAPEMLRIVLRVNKSPECAGGANDPRVHGGTRTHLWIPSLKAAAASRNPEALVCLDYLYASASSLPNQ